MRRARVIASTASPRTGPTPPDGGWWSPAPPSRHRGRSARARSSPPCAIPDRKSTRLNSSHLVISYAVFCLKKKKQHVRVEFPVWITESSHVHLLRLSA